MAQDLTPNQAIDALRKLPEDQQRLVLGKLTPDVLKAVRTKLEGPATDWTANPRGEGLYRMMPADVKDYTDTSKEIQVPFSKVNDALGSGLHLHPDEEPRYAKDAAHQGEGPTLIERATAKVHSLLQPSTGIAGHVPIPLYPGADLNQVKAAARVVASTPEFIKDLATAIYTTATGQTDSSAILNKIDPGQVPVQLQQQFHEDLKQDPSGRLAADNLVGTLVGMGLIGKATEGTTEALGKVVNKAGTLEPVRLAGQTVLGAGSRTIKNVVEKAAKAAKTADEKHLETTQDALHETAGREIAHKQYVTTAKANAAKANAMIEEQHSNAVQDALQQTLEKEELYRNELKKAKEESEDAYHKKLMEVEEKRAKAEIERKQELHDYFEKTKDYKSDKEKAQDERDRKEALERGVEHIDPDIKYDLEKTEDATNIEANRRYNVLNNALDSVQTDPDMMPRVVREAMEKMKGSATLPTILKDMEARVEHGDVFTYRDLQGYRSELGRELRKGTLPGDVFTAYKGLQEEVTNGMEEVAAREDDRIALQTGNKLPKEETFLGRLQAARDYYRRYAETFIDRRSPVRKAINATERGQTIRQFLGKDQSGVEQVAQFNPELARRINTVRGYQTEASSIKPKTVTRAAPVLPPKQEPIPIPEPVEPRQVQQPTRVEPPDRPVPIEVELPKQPPRVETPDRPEQNVVDTSNLRDQFITEKLSNWTNVSRWQIARLMTGPIGAVIGFTTGHPLVGDIGAAYAIAEMTPFAIQRMLDNQAFRKWFIQPPDGELETLQKIPDADRVKIVDGLNKVVKQAQFTGKPLKIAPAVAAFLAGAKATPPPPGLPDVKKKAQDLQEPPPGPQSSTKSWTHEFDPVSGNIVAA